MAYRFLFLVLGLVTAANAVAEPISLINETLPKVQATLVDAPDPRAELWLRKAHEAYSAQFGQGLYSDAEKDTIAAQYGAELHPDGTTIFCGLVPLIEDQTEALELAFHRSKDPQVRHAYARVLPQSEYLRERFARHCKVPAWWTPRGMRRYFNHSASQYALTSAAGAPKAFVMRSLGVMRSDLWLMVSIGLGLAVLGGGLYMLAGLSPRVGRTVRVLVPGAVLMLAALVLVSAWLSTLS